MSSPVGEAAAAFLKERLPDRTNVAERWLKTTRFLAWLGLSRPRYADSLGSMFDTAVAFDLATVAPFQAYLTVLPQAARDTLLDAFGYHWSNNRSEWTRNATPPNIDLDPGTLRALGGLDFLIGNAYMIQDAETATKITEITMAGDDVSNDDLTNLWDRYQTYGRPKLSRFGPLREAQLPLYEGSQCADLLLGITLVEIKAITSDPADAVRNALDQVLGYALCDRADEHNIQEIAIYLAWQGVVLTTAIEDLLADSGVDPAEWPRLKEAFWDYSTQARADHDRLLLLSPRKRPRWADPPPAPLDDNDAGDTGR